MRSELKNQLFKRYGLALILVFLVAKLATYSLNYLVPYAVFMLTPDTSAYEKYVSMYEGKIDSEKQAEIEEIIKCSSGAAQMVGTANAEFNTGNATYEEYCLAIDKYAPLAGEYKNGMQQFAEQVEYVLEDTNERYLLDCRGWICLLKNENLDFLLVLMVIMLSVSTFTNEYSTDMYRLLLTSPLGRKKLAYRKCLSSIAICGLSTALFCVVEIITVYFKMGLPCPNAPLHSIEALSTSSFNISLIATLLILCALKVVGAVFLCAAVLFLSVMIKKSLPVISIAVTLIMIPYIAFPDIRDRLFFLPIGLIIPSGYILGEIGGLSATTVRVPVGVGIAGMILTVFLCFITCNLYTTENLLGRSKCKCVK